VGVRVLADPGFSTACWTADPPAFEAMSDDERLRHVLEEMVGHAHSP